MKVSNYFRLNGNDMQIGNIHLQNKMHSFMVVLKNWTLPDKAFLGIVVGVFLNKQNQEYQTAIQPIVYVAQRNNKSNPEEPITKALEYLSDN